MFKILYIDIIDDYKISLIVQNQESNEVIKVITKIDYLEKADNYKLTNKLINFNSLILSNQKQYKAKDFF